MEILCFVCLILAMLFLVPFSVLIDEGYLGSEKISDNLWVILFMLISILFCFLAALCHIEYKMSIMG